MAHSSITKIKKKNPLLKITKATANIINSNLTQFQKDIELHKVDEPYDKVTRKIQGTWVCLSILFLQSTKLFIFWFSICSFIIQKSNIQKSFSSNSSSQTVIRKIPKTLTVVKKLPENYKRLRLTKLKVKNWKSYLSFSKANLSLVMRTLKLPGGVVTFFLFMKYFAGIKSWMLSHVYL